MNLFLNLFLFHLHNSHNYHHSVLQNYCYSAFQVDCYLLKNENSSFCDEDQDINVFFETPIYYI